MTDAYIAAERLRNAARVQCSIEQLGTRWVLHPDNAVTRESHIEARRERVEVIDTRRLREAGFMPLREAFQRAEEGSFAAILAARKPVLLQHDGGAQ